MKEREKERIFVCIFGETRSLPPSLSTKSGRKYSLYLERRVALGDCALHCAALIAPIIRLVTSAIAPETLIPHEASWHLIICLDARYARRVDGKTGAIPPRAALDGDTFRSFPRCSELLSFRRTRPMCEADPRK